MNTYTQQITNDGTKIYSLGKGPALVVVHGGPGLEHTYLINPLKALAKKRTLYFYDQYGCGNNRILPEGFKLDDLVNQFLGVVDSISFDKHIDLIAHSWGAFIFYETLRLYPEIKFGKVILVSPVGLIRSRFDDSGERLISRIPGDVMGQVEKFMGENDGRQLMNLIAPYYMGRIRTDVSLDFKEYCSENFDRIVEKLGDYDCRGIQTILPKNLILIYGDNDIERPKDTAEIHSFATIQIVKDAGHFSFAEQNFKFLTIVNEFLNMEPL
jgi:pimeloyl-ACP methyl ester carboxylesterase